MNKQETLEEAAKGYAKFNKFISDRPFELARDKNSFIAGAKWQAERMYSEKDLEVAFYEGRENNLLFIEWFNQYKKK